MSKNLDRILLFVQCISLGVVVYAMVYYNTEILKLKGQVDANGNR
jgi:hypothetical protein